MTLQEFYVAAGGDYNEILARFRSEEKIFKYLRMFLSDETFDNLSTSMEALDFTTAFRMAHTLKGIAINLGLNNLFDVSSALTEKLRAMDLTDIDFFYKEVKECYSKVKELIIQII